MEYQKHGTVHGIKVQEGLQESEAFPGGAIYTPSTKAEAGQHDENIHPDKGGSSVRIFMEAADVSFSCRNRRLEIRPTD
jgi:phosphoribosylaminoimidazole-succinocarboxamide synthase